MQIGCDSKGVVRSPDLHDGSLEGILVENRAGIQHLVLSATDTQGRKVSIACPNVVRMILNNLREGNIVFALSLTEGSNIDTEDLKAVFDDDAYSDTWLGTQGRQDCTMMRISSSYGCDGLVLLRSRSSDIEVKQE